MNNQDFMDRATALEQYTVDRHTLYYNDQTWNAQQLTNNSFMLATCSTPRFLFFMIIVSDLRKIA